jgi:transcription-repair coupling factor (superfamily II helicase)
LNNSQDSQPQLPPANKQQGFCDVSALEPPQLSVNHQKAELLTELLIFSATSANGDTSINRAAETAGRRGLD